MTDIDNDHFFETYGPFPILLDDGWAVRPAANWWDEVDAKVNLDLSRAIGCYMFVLGDKRIRPWYVGKTVNQHGFREEVFTDHKLDNYNWSLDESGSRPAQLYLFPLITRAFNEDWLFAYGSSHGPVIEWLERTLIGMAYSQNENIANTRDTTFLKTVHVRGVIGRNPRGRRTGHIGKARQALHGERVSE